MGFSLYCAVLDPENKSPGSMDLLITGGFFNTDITVYYRSLPALGPCIEEPMLGKSQVQNSRRISRVLGMYLLTSEHMCSSSEVVVGSNNSRKHLQFIFTDYIPKGLL